MSITETEMVCPSCTGVPLPVYPPRCSRCEWAGDVADLVWSGRYRARQFPPGLYPQPVPFTRRGSL